MQVGEDRIRTRNLCNEPNAFASCVGVHVFTQAHLEEVLPAILDGLADESEGVRQAALAAGRTLVDLYALSALELLLPAVERGCAHENWRIRQSSVELLGDLLFKVRRLLATRASTVFPSCVGYLMMTLDA